MKEDYTHFVFILDSSGSMGGGWNTVKKGYKQMIEDQKLEEGKCTFSFYTFSTDLKEIENFTPINDVSGKLTVEPTGGTALYDSLNAVIDKTGDALSAMAEEDRPSKVLVSIQTDGYENRSTDDPRGEKVREAIERQRGTYKWQFIFLGENEACLDQAELIGISRDHTSTYANVSSMTKGLGTVVREARAASSSEYSTNFAVSEAARSVLSDETK